MNTLRSPIQVQSIEEEISIRRYFNRAVFVEIYLKMLLVSVLDGQNHKITKDIQLIDFLNVNTLILVHKLASLGLNDITKASI